MGKGHGYSKENNIEMKRSQLMGFLASVDLVFGFGNTHEHFDVFDWDPAGKDLHCVFEIRFQDNITHTIN